MLTQFISTMATLALIILGILIMTRAISLEEGLKAIGKALLVLVLVLVAVCSLVPALERGTAVLTALLTTVLRFLLVTVFVVGVLILFIRMLLWRFRARSKAKAAPNRGE